MNIVVFQSDDHARWASAVYGNRELHTPSMDFLARTGTRFDAAFTPNPVCSPARASFWTGKIPSAHGVHDYLHESGSSTDASVNHPGIGGQKTLASYLRDAGYATGLCGKWHCGGRGAAQPGFDYWFASARGTNARFGAQTFIQNGRAVEWTGHQSPRVTDAAVEFLRQQKPGRPFFLYAGYTDTHSPHAGAPERLVSRYRGCSFSDIPRESFNAVHGRALHCPPDDEAGRREHLAQYYAAVETIDGQVGRVLDELESMGALSETFIFYTSDHGHMNGHHGLHSKGNATLPQNLLDESVLVPLLVRPPQGSSSRVRAEFVDHCDTFATVMAIAGLTAPDSSPGKSYLPLLKDDETAWRDAQFSEYGNARMIRTRTHKLILRYAGPNGRFPDELYDLAADPREDENCIDRPEHAAVAAELSRRLNDYFARFEDNRVSGTRIGELPRCAPNHVWEIA